MLPENGAPGIVTDCVRGQVSDQRVAIVEPMMVVTLSKPVFPLDRLLLISRSGVGALTLRSWLHHLRK
jgi:hypothetical protein